MNQNHDDMVAHLSMIQGVINRMSAISATFKGLSATLLAGVLAVVITSDTNRLFILILAGVVIVSFMMLDYYYFYQEKKYRSFFEKVRNGEIESDFSMVVPDCVHVAFVEVLKSTPFLLFYLVLLAVISGFALWIVFSV